MEKEILKIYLEGKEYKIPLTSKEDIDNIISALKDIRDEFVYEVESQNEDIDRNECSNFQYCILNEQGVEVCKIHADALCGQLGDPHSFHQNGELVALVPASWAAIREDFLYEED